jgi:hypothetical protein
MNAEFRAYINAVTEGCCEETRPSIAVSVVEGVRDERYFSARIRRVMSAIFCTSVSAASTKPCARSGKICAR